MDMIRHYFRTAWRNIRLQPSYTISNLIGLSVGLLVILLISSTVIDQLSYDKHWKHADNLYRLQLADHSLDNPSINRLDRAPAGLGQALSNVIPEVQGASLVQKSYSKLMLDSVYDRRVELSILECDINFFNLFDIQATEGNPKHTYSQFKNIAISQEVHQQYFNKADVIGKIFYNIPEHGDSEPYVISAIIKEIPKNSHLNVDAILINPKPNVFQPGQGGDLHGQYILTKSGTDTALITQKINQWYASQQGPLSNYKRVIELRSIKDIHLKSDTGWKSPMTNLYILMGIGIIIIILISINYINLTLAHTLKRTQEFGVRRVLGADKKQVAMHIATESILIFTISFFIAFIGYLTILPHFENYLGQSLTYKYTSLSPMLTAFCIWLAIGIILSSIPAFLSSQSKIYSGLKKQYAVHNISINLGFTRTLIGVQFAITAVLCMCMLTFKEQLQYIDNKDLGYNPKGLLLLQNQEWGGKVKSFKNTLLSSSHISSVSLASWTPFSGAVNFQEIQSPSDPTKKENMVLIDADFDFIKTMGLKLIEGRQLSPAYALDGKIFYSAADSVTGYANVLLLKSTYQNFHFKLNESSPSLKRTPVGILEDFHAASLRFPLPTTISIEATRESDYGSLLVRAKPGKEKEAYEILHKTWDKFFPKRVAPVSWIEQQVKDQYANDRKQFQQIAFFSIVSILLALLGILGITIYSLAQKIKEIGIRRVLGASSTAIILLLTKPYTRLVLIASLVAIPIAYWLMKHWLDNFAYRIDIPILLFISTIIFLFIATFAVIGINVWRTARANPVNSLRDE
ncbi:ABC transporter permease [Sphingobacterium sp. UDSM-2020]|uniref:ABC transporter permease n=1 Tax=Sphingobacterium sp. UDSM-2020 TaxID=2795738 RepID=UPI001938A6A8|nr:ABC transporter permease [Sphingobacterium sp. UDSM-2020]QQD14476.1 FtsX-like permease family protein [Sphingobacterium sp. UDSM-2020]